MFSLWLCSSGVSLRLHVRATGPCPSFAALREFTSADKREWAVLCVGHRLPSCPHVFYVCAHKAMCEVTFPCGPRQENVPACGGPASACVTAYCFCSRDDAEPCPEGWDHLGSVHAHCYGPKYEVWLYTECGPPATLLRLRGGVPTVDLHDGAAPYRPGCIRTDGVALHSFGSVCTLLVRGLCECGVTFRCKPVACVLIWMYLGCG